MLAQAVEKSSPDLGEKVSWKKVANSLTGRSQLDCRVRWRRILLSRIVKITNIKFWFPEEVKFIY